MILIRIENFSSKEIKMTLNRVVVTGYGLTSPIGNTPEEFWNNLHDGKIGIGPITKFDNSEIPVHNAGEIHDFPFDKYFVRKDKNRMDQYSLYAIYATLEALENAKLDMDTVDRDRTGVIVSSGIGGLQEMQEQIIRMHEKGIKRIQPMFIPKALSNMAAGNIALRIGARGVCKSITTACASSNDAIGEAFREIKFGYHDVILAGGAESAINEIGIGGFNALTALSTTEDPARSAIPFDKDRNGFVMGEGAGVLVLESLEHAQKRGATILAEVVGYGSNCDAYHQTTPTPDGSGAAKAIKLAIKEAGISPEDVDYVNAHGTSTQANEKGESKAIVTVLGKDVPVSSTKSFTGHLLGAAGAVEAVATIEALRHNYIPMTAGTRELSEDIEANVVYGQGQEAELEYAISNTFGFGGHNAVLAFKRWEA
jgi:3-oxoacyl-[acyl-carrier-protein] synthase II